MKALIFTLSLATLLILTYACQTPTQSEDSGSDTSAVVSDGHHSQMALDWQGTYIGTLPCADCEGIETKLSLHDDQSYLMQSRYLGKDEQVFEQDGTFSWNPEGNTITLDNVEDGPSQYLVGENSLSQLDQSGKPISGALAQNYVLTKKDTMHNSSSDKAAASITDTRWRLTELIGQPVDSSVNDKEPFIMLSSEEQRLTGNGGCNTISGSYKLKEGNRISFSQMITTRMACPNMEVERQLLEVLEGADNYSLSGNQLTLNKARMAPLARFEAVDDHK